MKPKPRVSFALLFLFLLSCTTRPKSQPTVAVWHEVTDSAQQDGATVQKIDILPWRQNLTLAQAIAGAGGYSTPLVRSISLVRDGKRIRIPEVGYIQGNEGDVILQPGDRVEIRR